jgi:acylphosphatase
MISGLHVIIEGRVQGVGYRFFARENALKLGLTGWVRNTYDGNVEGYAEGSKEDLEKWINILQKGPRSSCVTAIKQDWKEPQGKFKTFQIAPSS